MSDEFFNRAEKAALKKQMKTSVKGYVKEYLDAEAKKAARAIVKELKADIKTMVEKEFKARLPKAVRSAVGKIHTSVHFWTNSKRLDWRGKPTTEASKI